MSRRASAACVATLVCLAFACAEEPQVGPDVLPPDARFAPDARSSGPGLDAASVPDTAPDTADAGESGADAARPEPDAGEPDAGPASQPDSGVDPGVDLGNGVTVSPSVLVPGGTATIRYRGTLAGRDNLTVHYGFNGWNHVAGPAFQENTDSTGNKDFFLRKPMERLTGSSGFETTVSLPADARALHFVFFSSDGTNQTWDNNDGKDFGREILFPYVGPLLSYMGSSDPTTEVHIAFHTGHACIGKVEYGASSQLGTVVREAAASPSHKLHLQGLSPGSTVHYRVSCEGAGASDVYSFRTPAAGSARLTFVVLSDMQEDGERTAWGRVAEEVLANHSDADLVLSAGDNAWNDQPGHWWTFFDKGRALFAGRPFMAAPGNHDTPTVGSNSDTSSFERWFHFDNASGSEIAYRFRYGPALFLALGTERPDELIKDTGSQYRFAQETLADLGGTTWAFAYWHVGPYNAGARHFSQVGISRDVTALFDGKVDWVFCGHEHLFQRHWPLRYNAQKVDAYGNGANQGVGYVVTPPAGTWPNKDLIPRTDPKAYYRERVAKPLPSGDSDGLPSELGFVVVKLDGRSLAMKGSGMGTRGAPLAAHEVDSVLYLK